MTHEYIDKNYQPSGHSCPLRGHPRSSSSPSMMSRRAEKGPESSLKFRRQCRLSRSYHLRGSPVRSKNSTRSRSLVEIPAFTENPANGAAKLPSRIRSRTSLKDITEGKQPIPSQSLVQIPIFTDKPEKGATERLSRTPSKTSLNTIVEAITAHNVDVNGTGREINEVFR